LDTGLVVVPHVPVFDRICHDLLFRTDYRI
jgi:hypothetical protein